MSISSMLLSEPHRYITYAQTALPLFLKFCDIKDRAGGYLSGVDHNSDLVLTARIGRVVDDGEKPAFSVEKCRRLLKLGHETSHQSAQPEKGQYGGAVKLKVGALGFSGLKQLDDEAFSLLLGVATEDLNLQDARAMAAVDNVNFRRLLENNAKGLWDIIHECRKSE